MDTQRFLKSRLQQFPEKYLSTPKINYLLEHPSLSILLFSHCVTLKEHSEGALKNHPLSPAGGTLSHIHSPTEVSQVTYKVIKMT